MQISAVVSNLHVATTPRYLWLEMAGRFVVRNGGKIICGLKFSPPRGIVYLGFLHSTSLVPNSSFYLPLMSTYRRMKHVTDRQFDVCPSVSTQTDGCRRRTNEWRKVTYRPRWTLLRIPTVKMYHVVDLRPSPSFFFDTSVSAEFWHPWTYGVYVRQSFKFFSLDSFVLTPSLRRQKALSKGCACGVSLIFLAGAISPWWPPNKK